MAFRTWWVEGDKLIVVQLRFQPMPVWISTDRMSIIVEIRDAKTEEIIEVWHMHMRYEDGKIVHRDRKYP
ncbi:hypothetical protein [Thermococcus sp.]